MFFKNCGILNYKFKNFFFLFFKLCLITNNYNKIKIPRGGSDEEQCTPI